MKKKNLCLNIKGKKSLKKSTVTINNTKNHFWPMTSNLGKRNSFSLLIFHLHPPTHNNSFASHPSCNSFSLCIVTIFCWSDAFSSYLCFISSMTLLFQSLLQVTLPPRSDLQSLRCPSIPVPGNTQPVNQTRLGNHTHFETCACDQMNLRKKQMCRNLGVGVTLGKIKFACANLLLIATSPHNL